MWREIEWAEGNLQTVFHSPNSPGRRHPQFETRHLERPFDSFRLSGTLLPHEQSIPDIHRIHSLEVFPG